MEGPTGSMPQAIIPTRHVESRRGGSRGTHPFLTLGSVPNLAPSALAARFGSPSPTRPCQGEIRLALTPRLFHGEAGVNLAAESAPLSGRPLRADRRRRSRLRVSRSP